MKGVQQRPHEYWRKTDSRNFARAVSLDFSNTARSIIGRSCILASAIPSPSSLLESRLQESRNVFALHFIFLLTFDSLLFLVFLPMKDKYLFVE